MARASRKRFAGNAEPCCNCGSRQNVERHHIVPLSRGGRDVETNLCWLCRECHLIRVHDYKYDLVTLAARKHGRPPTTTLTEETEAIIRRFLNGEIGNAEAMRLLGVAPGNHSVRCCKAYRQFEEKYGRQPRRTNHVDLRREKNEHVGKP